MRTRRRAERPRARPAARLRRRFIDQTDDIFDDDEREVEIGGGEDKPRGEGQS